MAVHCATKGIADVITAIDENHAPLTDLDATAVEVDKFQRHHAVVSTTLLLVSGCGPVVWTSVPLASQVILLTGSGGLDLHEAWG